MAPEGQNEMRPVGGMPLRVRLSDGLGNAAPIQELLPGWKPMLLTGVCVVCSHGKAKKCARKYRARKRSRNAQAL